MGCLDKVIGTILGLLAVAAGIYGMVTGACNTAILTFFIIGGGLFTLLNLFIGYEAFETFEDIMFGSPIGVILGKWFILALISGGIAYVAAGIIFGFDAL